MPDSALESCKHETVDASIWKPTPFRGWRSYREYCMDCGATRCREFIRWFWGKWSPWSVSGHCCMDLDDKECSQVAVNHCQGWVPDAK